MKKILIISLILTISTVYAATETWPRADTSCGASNKSIQTKYWDGQKCEDCASDLCVCSNYWTCDKCITNSGQGYGLAYYEKYGINICRSCGQSYVSECCFANNIWDSDATRATKCFDHDDNDYEHYVLGGHVCYRDKPCASYYDNFQCKSCYDGYYMDASNNCQVCEKPHCVQCGGPYHCKKCSDDDSHQGYYLERYDSTVPETSESETDPFHCYTCDTNCKCTDHDNKCTGCVDSLNGNHYYYNSTDKACKVCIDFCTKCSDDETCTQCYTNYHLSTDKKSCKPCSDAHCELCTEWDTENEKFYCKKENCHNGYFWKKISDDSSYGECTVCTDGTAPFKDEGQIARCNADGTEITQCDEFNLASYTREPHASIYYLIQAKNGDSGNAAKCVQNTNNCKKMISPATTTDEEGKCAECYTKGYDGALYAMDTETKICENCYQWDHCVACKFYSAEDKKKVLCSQCEVQTDAGYYNDQTVNYFLDDNNTCTSCGTGCWQCTTADSCTTCKAGYRKNDKSCEQCSVTNCKKCDANVSQCTECFGGYYPDKSDDNTWICANCDQYQPTQSGSSRCMSCSADRKTCTLCDSGSYLFNGACFQKRSNCLLWNTSGGACTLCDYGYRLVDGYCRSGYGNGYVNLSVGCTGERYVRDDDVLIAGFVSASVLLFNILALLSLVVVLLI